MVKILLSLVMGLTLMISSSLADSAPNMKEGKWEITSKMEMVGMPMEMPAATVTQCLTRQDMVPNNAQQGQECTMSDMRTSGDTVTWRMTCRSPGGNMVGNGKIHYSRDRFKGTMEMSQEGMKMINRMSGRYLGECE